MRNIFICVSLSFLILSCQQDDKRIIRQDSENIKLLEALSTEQTGVDFNNKIEETLEINTFTYDGLLQGSGVAVLDYNNDGKPDIYFAATQGKDKLYENLGNFKFKDVTQAAGILQGDYYSTGISIIDINGDGYDDIYVNRFMHTEPAKRKNVFYINDGKGGFVDKAEAYGLVDTGFSTCATFFDMDGDNDLDLYVGNQPPNDFFSKQSMKNIKDFSYTDRLYRNDGAKFTDITQNANVTNYCYTLSVNPIDYNQDGWIDLMIAADYEEPDLLLHNNGNGTFTNVANNSFRHISNFSMGTDVCDINNDGLLDIFTVDMVAEDNYRQKTNMSGMNPEKFWKLAKAGYHHQYMFNAMHLNNGNGTFSEIAQLSGISNTDWSWTPLFVDIDQDGLQDLMVTNGVYQEVRNKDYSNWRKDYFKKAQAEAERTGEVLKWDPLKVSQQAPSIKLANFVYKNNGDLEFEKMNDAWDFNEPSWSSGAAYADFDGDGDLDFVINNSNHPAFMYRNRANEESLNNYILIELDGPGGNKYGIGAEVEVFAGDLRQKGQINPYRGYMSSSAASVHFGLGENSIIDRLTVRWPDGKLAEYTNVNANTTLTLKYTDANQNFQPSKTNSKFKAIAQNEEVRHIENEYNDYTREVLLPHKMSTLGPVVAVADINNDGNDDFYLGGSAGQAGSIYLGSAQKQFKKMEQAAFQKDVSQEDGDALFFDIDGDDDMDLYVASGGNEKDRGDAYYADRLYINENGTFRKSSMPSIKESTGAIAAHDYDGDGDIDLFVGGRQVPGKYGNSPKSYILENNQGKLSITKEWEAGMVTDALFMDTNNDNKKELIITGEWMPISVWSYTDSWKDITTESGLANSNGWWNKLEMEDIDGDGDMDLLAGNLGLNLKFKASKDQPFKLYVDDFDDNGTNDVYLGYYANDGKCYPVRGRQCSSEQMPFVKEKFATYNDFGSATIIDVLDDKMGQNTVKQEVYHFQSAMLINDGTGKFKIENLENKAQIAPIFGFAVMDINKDGKKDIFAAGNYYNREVETTRSDAGTGISLIQGENGNFESLSVSETGIFAYKDVRAVETLKAGDETIIAIFNNNDAAEFYSLN